MKHKSTAIIRQNKNSYSMSIKENKTLGVFNTNESRGLKI